MAKAKGKGGLGRGLGALMTDYEEISQALEHKEGVIELELDKVFANPDQPRNPAHDTNGRSNRRQ